MPYAASTSTRLGKDQLFVWQARRGATLEVHRGRVWVTASNQLDDHFIDAGERLALPGRSRVVISGECEAAISIRVSPLYLHWLAQAIFAWRPHPQRSNGWMFRPFINLTRRNP